MKKENKSKDIIFPVGNDGAISYDKINNVCSSFADDSVQGEYTLDPLMGDSEIEKLVSLDETLNNQRVDREKDQRVMSTLNDVLAINETGTIGLKDYFVQIIEVLLKSTSYAYRTFTLAKNIDFKIDLSNEIMHVVNALALAIINEIEFINPISIEAQEIDGSIELTYKSYVKLSDNLEDNEIEELFPSISTRKSYLDAVCKEYYIENSFAIRNNQLSIRYILPIGTQETTTFGNDPLSMEAKESILYYLDLFAY